MSSNKHHSPSSATFCIFETFRNLLKQQTEVLQNQLKKHVFSTISDVVDNNLNDDNIPPAVKTANLSNRPTTLESLLRYFKCTLQFFINTALNHIKWDNSGDKL